MIFQVRIVLVKSRVVPATLIQLSGQNSDCLVIMTMCLALYACKFRFVILLVDFGQVFCKVELSLQNLVGLRVQIIDCGCYWLDRVAWLLLSRLLVKIILEKCVFTSWIESPEVEEVDQNVTDFWAKIEIPATFFVFPVVFLQWRLQ